jgi:hypothetical protein
MPVRRGQLARMGHEELRVLAEGGRTVAGDERAGQRRDTDPSDPRRERLVGRDDPLDVSCTEQQRASTESVVQPKSKETLKTRRTGNPPLDGDPLADNLLRLVPDRAED